MIEDVLDINVPEGFTLDFTLPVIHEILVLEYKDGYLIGFHTMHLPESPCRKNKMSIEAYVHMLNWAGLHNQPHVLVHHLMDKNP